ncbi:glycoside hydrolase family 2 TIM barrel-domain containing protein [Microbacterium sp. Mcb102]|uniref:glycoside hydrolase family 2 TIM barrel-domain containing protein n=1 Tax=Microbacterium sp. Mcb102 TaxID=2926012 RepID=UPI0021C6A345|nr:glycoside hydrolase family 2 TIM barrel-domain containing protein [Microbacterium sp. Mcb102]
MTTAPPMPTSRHELGSWSLSSSTSPNPATVRLPHDAMLAEKRSPEAAGGSDTAYFPGGSYTYTTQWTAPHTASPYVALNFEGVQGEATVLVNDALVGEVRSGYSECDIEITEHVRWGEVNDIRVVVDNRQQPSNRWYPGSGLYRAVSVILRPDVRFKPDGVRLRTRSMSSSVAHVDVAFQLEHTPQLRRALSETHVSVTLWDDDRRVAYGEGFGIDGLVSLRVPEPRGWSATTPHLYELVAQVERDGVVLDECRERVGLRTISVDAHQGLRINGESVLLRGACIHHDNGPIGAATFRAAEYRRIRLLKEAGFNAIRSAHNPMSRHLLDACDEIGMYVLDELADYWVVSKTAHDFAWRFRDTWREDADRMVQKDRNRPSVIMYASGNEIPETATAEGIGLTREITEYLHEIDPERPVTVAINLFLNTLVSLNQSPYKERPDDAPSMAGSTEANVMINQIGRMMDVVSRLPRADKASRAAFANVDIAGYNYGLGRYRRDVRAYPERVILGSETLPGDVARAWRLVNKYPAVIGDFVWAGWEYLGEAGVSVWVEGKKAGLSKPYPYLISGPGMFDLTGRPDITLRLAQAAWGNLNAPAIGVRPVNLSGVPMVRSAWRKTDAVESWSWRDCEGKLAQIEVYSADDRVTLLLNGRRIGSRRTGRRRGYVAKFVTPYEPGTLTAIAFRNGIEVSRTTLRSARGPLHVTLDTEADSIAADGDDLVFAHIALQDEIGTVEMLADEEVEIEVSGPGELIGYGTAAPATEEEFIATTRTTFRGRALAVVRSTGEPGTITITARSKTAGDAIARVDAVASAAPDHDTTTLSKAIN